MFPAILAVCLVALTACNNKTSNSNSEKSSKALSSITESECSSITAKAPKIELSGKPEDTFTATSDCYVESDKVILFIQKGVTIKGDTLKITEKVMNDLSVTSGLTFNENYTSEDSLIDWQENYFDKDSFTDINKNKDKINVLITKLENGEIQWANDNIALLDQNDFIFKDTQYQTIYHELSHVIQFRNGISLGSVLDEGFATYLADKAGRTARFPIWNSVQYFYPYQFDESIVKGGEKTFKYMYGDKDTNYQYGIRFITFLYDTYGKDAFNRILAEATKEEFSSGWDAKDENGSQKRNTELLVKIIKSQTSNDVFEKFTTWYVKNWSIKGKEYKVYMKSIGLDVPN